MRLDAHFLAPTAAWSTQAHRLNFLHFFWVEHSNPTRLNSERSVPIEPPLVHMVCVMALQNRSIRTGQPFRSRRSYRFVILAPYHFTLEPFHARNG